MLISLGCSRYLYTHVYVTFNQINQKKKEMSNSCQFSVGIYSLDLQHIHVYDFTVSHCVVSINLISIFHQCIVSYSEYSEILNSEYLIVLFILGLYLRPEYIPENLSLFKGIAVRLEENILVTEKDPINLSEKVSPREKSFLARDADECMIDEKAQRIIAKLISNTGIK